MYIYMLPYPAYYLYVYIISPLDMCGVMMKLYCFEAIKCV